MEKKDPHYLRKAGDVERKRAGGDGRKTKSAKCIYVHECNGLNDRKPND